jgi:enterochelin esterase family protein
MLATPVVPNPGTVRLHTPFADGRRVWVYLPPEPRPAELPSLVVFDGRLYKDQLALPQMLDYLIGTGRIPAAAALMVDNADRTELICRPEYGQYLAGALMPWFREMYPVSPDPGQTVVIGSSYGGLAAVYCVFVQPGLFGNVLSQTGWFRWRPEGSPDSHWLAAQIAAVPLPAARFWLQVGSLEEARMLDGGPTQLAANRHMRDVLQASGCAVSYREYPGGHDASSLEAPLAEGIVEILGASRPV